SRNASRSSVVTPIFSCKKLSKLPKFCSIAINEVSKKASETEPKIRILARKQRFAPSSCMYLSLLTRYLLSTLYDNKYSLLMVSATQQSKNNKTTINTQVPNSHIANE